MIWPRLLVARIAAKPVTMCVGQAVLVLHCNFLATMLVLDDGSSYSASRALLNFPRLTVGAGDSFKEMVNWVRP